MIAAQKDELNIYIYYLPHSDYGMTCGGREGIVATTGWVGGWVGRGDQSDQQRVQTVWRRRDFTKETGSYNDVTWQTANGRRVRWCLCIDNELDLSRYKASSGQRCCSELFSQWVSIQYTRVMVRFFSSLFMIIYIVMFSIL